MDHEEKTLFLEDVYGFLDESSNPSIYVDQGERGKFLHTNSINSELVIKNNESEEENKNLEEKNQSLLSLVNELEKLLENSKTENIALRKSKENIQDAYQKLDQEYKKIANIISAKSKRVQEIEKELDQRPTFEQSSKLKAELDKINAEKDTLLHVNSQIIEENKRLVDDLSGTLKYTVNGGNFEPLGVKRRKDQTFDLKKMSKKKQITLSFRVKGNIPSENGKTISLKIVAHIPEKRSKETERLIEENITVIVGNKKTVELPINDIDFGSGLYKVQIFHEDTSETIPLEILYFNAQRLFDKSLK